MARLTPDQHRSVAEWAAQGATLNEIQDRLKREFGLTLTYMDARLLLMELGIRLVDKPKEQLPESEIKPSPADGPPEDEPGHDDADFPPNETSPPGIGSVTVTLDQIAIPGTMVSGKAAFSDGKTVGWQLDQFGRLGLRGTEPGYQPPAADIPAFQRELQRLLQSQGY